MGILDQLAAMIGRREPAPPAIDPARAYFGVDWRREPSLSGFRAPRTGALRNFMAASNDRLVADLMEVAGMTSGNSEVRMSLRAMRIRSRRLANDNEYVKRFLQLIRNNVAGPRGFELQMKIYKSRKTGGQPQLDTGANDTIEDAYKAFSRKGVFSADGKYSRAAFERAALTNMARDGEVIIELLIGARFGRFGMAWRFLDPDLLDEALNVGTNGAIAGVGRLDAGNSVRMGVEIDAYEKPVAYWFHSAHPADDVVNVPIIRHRRVPADRIIHLFAVDEMRPGVTRGVPWMFAALRRMAMLGGYEEAALVASRQGASKMGWFKPPAPEPGTPAASIASPDGSDLADSEDEQGNLITEAEPGTFGVLPAGWDFQTYDPAYPNDKMEGFVKAMLRAYASGVGLTYNTPPGDLENVDLSSMRHGALNDRDTYEAIQQICIDGMSVPMFEASLRMMLDLGQLGTLPMDGFERFNKPKFIARTFRSPDPQKDIAANAQAVSLGVRSRTKICAENGEDFEDVLNELAAEEQLAREKGVTLNTAAALAHKTPAVDDAGKPVKPGAEAQTKPEEEDDDAVAKQ
ncbi:MAG: phage portal protein [Burkholderiaceae bacterium]